MGLRKTKSWKRTIKGAYTVLLLGLPFILAELIQRFQIAHLLEFKIDTILVFSGLTMVALFGVLKLTDRRALIRRGPSFSRREFVTGTVLLGCMDFLGLLAFELVLFGGILSPGINVGLFFVWIVVVIGPMLEEWFFRHLLISGLKRVYKHFRGPNVPIFFFVTISAVVFGFTHLVDRSLVYVPSIIYGGFLYGIGYVKYGLVSAILLHAAGNLVIVLLL